MSATKHPTSHYVLHEFHYRHEDSELIGARRHCIFDLRFTMDGKAMRHEASFDALLDAAERHAPKVYDYINGLMEEIDATYLDYTELVDALAEEGFDFELLVRTYLDQMSADSFYKVDAPPPELLEAATKVGEEIKEMGFDELRKGMLLLQKAGEYLELDKRLLKKAKGLMNKSFLRLNEFDKKKRGEFYDLVNHYTWQMATKIVGLRWMGMVEDEAELDKWEACFVGMEPEGMKARILEGRSGYREVYPHAFSLELVGMEDWWEVVGDNKVMLYAHVVSEEGDAYLDVHFKDLKDEAYLYDPALYERILVLEGSLDGIMPKEAEVVRALLSEGWDLIPLLHSYCKGNSYMKTCIICKKACNEMGGDPLGEYYEYLKRKVDNPPSNYCEWSKKCAIVKDKLVKLLLGIVEADFPELMEDEDYRVTAWLVRELKVICSNMLYDIKQEYSELHEGGVVWPD